MKMEFMEGKKNPSHSQLPALGEGQKQETDPGASLAHRLQAGLSRAAPALGTGQAAAQRVHSDIIPRGPGMLPQSQGATTAWVDKACASSEENF